MIRHNERPDDNRMQCFAEAFGFMPVSCRPYLGDALPDLTLATTAAVVFKGWQSAADFATFPYQVDEMALVGKVIAADLHFWVSLLPRKRSSAHLGGRWGR